MIISFDIDKDNTLIPYINEVETIIVHMQDENWVTETLQYIKGL